MNPGQTVLRCGASDEIASLMDYLQACRKLFVYVEVNLEELKRRSELL